MSAPLNAPIVKAVLGPTNTGKTHYAVERMLGRQNGVIGLPLRLLAREVYDRICQIKSPAECALITGEEKIVPPHARYFVCTVEAMPLSRPFAFVAVDEVQLMANPERGHVFTDRVLRARGYEETLLLGAENARPLIKRLLPDIEHERRERFSTLSYSGPIKITRLPKRSVIVAFSAGEVYALAELIRRFRGGAAIVMGALSPRTRNAQAELYQSGEVDFLIATDAVGMGLNLDADHVAFASIRKFDGRRRRRLTPMEVGQIAGRAGRFRNDGTFGPTGDCPVFDTQLVSHIEQHNFAPLTFAEWRNSALDFSSLPALQDALGQLPPQKGLRRIAPATDELTLEHFAQMEDIKARKDDSHHTRLVWDICQVPDFLNLSQDSHIRLMREIYGQLTGDKGVISDNFMNRRISPLDIYNGGVEILSTRLAKIRTWTYCANRSDWLDDSKYWVERARSVENALSDALHEKLTARFVDRRTRALLKGAMTGTHKDAAINDDGEVHIGEHRIGQLTGLSFVIDESGSDLEAKALRQAAEDIVTPEINRRLTSMSGAAYSVFTLDEGGRILWGGAPVGRIAASGSIFNPAAEIIGAQQANPALRALAETRIREFLQSEARAKLEPLYALKELSNDPDAKANVRGAAYQMLENHGHLDRSAHGNTIKQLDQLDRKVLRDLGVVFGQYDVYMRELIRPKPARILNLLLAYGAGGDGKPFIPFAGVTSIANTGDFQSDHFSAPAIAAGGYKALGPRIIRFDILNRLAALIRQAQREAGTRRFRIMQEMLALLGSTYEEARGVLKALGYQSQVLEDDNPEALRPELAAQVPERYVTNQLAKQGKPDGVGKIGAAYNKAPGAEEASDKKADKPELDKPELSVVDENKADEPKTATKTEAFPAVPVPPDESAITTADVKAMESIPIHSAKRPQPKNRPLSVFQFRETGEDGTVTELENREYWFLPFRKNSEPRHGGDRTFSRQNKSGVKTGYKRGGKQDNKHGGKGKPGRRGKAGATNKTQNDYKSKEPRKDEDSPFAALASLKNSLKKTPPDES